MTKLVNVCRHIRSKNAGPFWITVDVFFADKNLFELWRHSPTLRPEVLASRFNADPATVRWQAIPELAAVKFSYPRKVPQGGVLERDMHGGQQFVKLLDLDLLHPE